jgi:hypothetical protein
MAFLKLAPPAFRTSAPQAMRETPSAPMRLGPAHRIPGFRVEPERALKKALAAAGKAA